MLDLYVLDLYLELPRWVRWTVALTTLTLGTAMAVGGHLGRPRQIEIALPDGQSYIEEKGGSVGAGPLFRGGLIVTGIGCALLLGCGKSSAEKSGYNF